MKNYYCNAWALLMCGLMFAACVPNESEEPKPVTPVIPKDPSPTPKSPNISRGLLAYYSFDKQNANNETGNADYNAKISEGTVTYVGGGKGQQPTFVSNTPSGKGYALKGTNKEMVYALKPNPLALQDIVTMSIWFKGMNDNVGLIHNRGNSELFSPLAIEGGKIVCTIDPWDAFRVRFKADLRETLLDGLWHHITLVYKSYDYKLYVDGALIERNQTVGFDGFGRYYQGWMGYHNVTIDELRIYNRELIAEEVKFLYDNKQ